MMALIFAKFVVQNALHVLKLRTRVSHVNLHIIVIS
jgi:hypothetical protein